MADTDDIIVRVDTATHTEWLSICEQSDKATFFHTPYWSALFERSFGGRNTTVPHLLRFGDGTVLLLPVAINRRFGGLLRTTYCMPGGTFGGWLSIGQIPPEKEAAAAAYLDRFANMTLRENPYQPIAVPIVGCKSIEDHTRTIDLTTGYDAAWMRATAAHRNAARNALRRGVTIHEAVLHADWEIYASVYLKSIERWKARSIFTGAYYPPSFFGKIERIEPSLRTLFLATVKGVVVAGILCFRWKRHMVVWHGAGLADYFSYHPNDLLYDRAIAHAVGNGCAWLDCNPSGGLAGVDKFKKHLGAEKLRCRLFVRRSPLVDFLGKLRRRRNE